MLSRIFDAEEKVYKNANMQTRIILDIISAEANAKFSAKVSNIVSKRNWGREEFDPNDRITSQHMNADLEAAIYTKHTLIHLYESEYGEMTDEIKDIIEKGASLYANLALRRLGWIKEEV